MSSRLSTLIKTYRNLFGLTQQQMADEVGINLSNYKRLESGRLLKMEETLKVLVWLTGENNV